MLSSNFRKFSQKIFRKLSHIIGPRARIRCHTSMTNISVPRYQYSQSGTGTAMDVYTRG